MGRDESEEIRRVIREHAAYLKEADTGKKIVCVLNNHEIPYRLDAINAFVRCVRGRGGFRCMTVCHSQHDYLQW